MTDNIIGIFNQNKLRKDILLQPTDVNVIDEPVDDDVLTVRNHGSSNKNNDGDVLQRRKKFLNGRKPARNRPPLIRFDKSPMQNDLNLLDSSDSSDDHDLGELRHLKYKSKKNRKKKKYIEMINEMDDIENDDHGNMSTKQLKNLYQKLLRDKKNRTKFMLMEHIVYILTLAVEKTVSLLGHDDKIKGVSNHIWENRGKFKIHWDGLVDPIEEYDEATGTYIKKPNPSWVNQTTVNPWASFLIEWVKSIIWYYSLRDIHRLAEYVSSHSKTDDVSTEDVEKLLRGDSV